MEIQLSSIIKIINPIDVIGDSNVVIKNLKQLTDNTISIEDIIWSNDKNLFQVYRQNKGTFIVSDNVDRSKLHQNCNYIIVTSPRKAFQKIIAKFFVKKQKFSTSPSATVHKSVTINKNVYLGENVVIEKNVSIGSNVLIDHNTVIKANTMIESNVSIGSNCTIGGIGFGYEKNENNKYELIHHIGNVILKEGVEIGNNTAIDRGVIGSTVLHKNVKVDNLVHIAHGVIIHENSMIIANSLIAGSTIIEKNSWVAPSASIMHNVVVGEQSLIGMGAVVIKNVEKQSIVVGNPAKRIK